MVDWNNIREAQAAITAWANENFPKRTAHSALVKLVLEEVPELLQSLDSPLEYADCLVLLFDIASLRGIDISQALAEKMAINQSRQWHFDDATGLAHHIKGTDNEYPDESEGGNCD